MTLTAPPPKLERQEESCTAAAEELSALGAGAHAEPEPLRVRAIRRQRFGPLVYGRLTFEHDPMLPRSVAAAGLGGNDARRVRGPSDRAMAAAAVHRHRDIRCVHLQSGRGPGFGTRDGGRRGGVYADFRAQRDARAAPDGGSLGPGRQRRTAVRDRGAVGVSGRSAGCRAIAATEASPHRRCLARPNGVAGERSCATREVGRRTVLARWKPRGASPDVCKRCRSGSLAGSMRKAAADCAGDLLGIANQQVDPCLALSLWHAHRRPADRDRAKDVACGIEYRCGKPGC
jgi:hypothetical protein